MKKCIFGLLLFVLFANQVNGTDTSNISTDQVNEEDTSNLVLLDQIDVVIIGHDDTEIITQSDLDRQSLGGGYRTQDDIIFEKIILLDAKKHQIPDDPEAVEAGFAQMRREHNLSDEDIEAIFKAAGFTYEEGKQQFQIMQMVNTMLDIKVRSNLIVPRKDVEAYYNENPEIVEATYTLERLFVPFSTKMSKQTQRRKIIHYIKTSSSVPNAEEGITFTISHSEVAPQKQFIYKMEPGNISAPQEVANGFEMFRLVSKTPEYRKTLEESYRDIVDILRRPKYEELLEKYRDQLLQSVSIIYM